MLRFPTIVMAAVDHADRSRPVVEAAAALAEATASELHLVHVKLVQSPLRNRPIGAAQSEAMHAEAADLLAVLGEHARVAGHAVTTTHVRFDDDVSEALAAAQAEVGAGLLVVGAPRPGWWRRSPRLTGDIATRAARRAPGSVLVVRP